MHQDAERSDVLKKYKRSLKNDCSSKSRPVLVAILLILSICSVILNPHEAHLTVCEGDCEKERLSELQTRKHHDICPTYTLTS